MTRDASRAPLGTSGRARASRASAYADFAPAVGHAWADAFVLELRLADVPGRAIGDALVEVGSHCAQSGESADDAFGDPVAYARSLPLPTAQESGFESFGSLLPWVLQMLGLLLVTPAVTAARDGEPVDVTSGHLVVLVLAVLSVLALTRWASAAMRAVAHHPLATWLGLMAHTALMVAVFFLLRDVVVRLPGPLALVACAVLLVIGTLWALSSLRAHPDLDDPVAATLRPTDRTSRWTGILRYGAALLMPVAAVTFAVSALLLAP